MFSFNDISVSTIEATAHYMRGVFTMYFWGWCLILRLFAKRNRMMKLLFITTVWITICNLKDIVFLVEEWKHSLYIENIVNIVDLIYVPLLCAFFLEVTRPGIVKTKYIITGVVCQCLFLPIFLLTESKHAVDAACMASGIMALITTVEVFRYAIRYNRYIRSNYSYTEGISVTWVTIGCSLYFCSFFFYCLAFQSVTWQREILFDVFSITACSFLFAYARRHRVIVNVDSELTQVLNTKAGKPHTDKQMEEPCDTTTLEEMMNCEEEAEKEWDIEDIRFQMIGDSLKQLMQKEKPFLDPKLTINEVAVRLGSNKTYLSYYLNNHLNVSFYDYVNALRVDEACRVIDEMTEETKKSVAEVAQMSGFNSMSTFHRYFRTQKGITPTAYYKQRDLQG